MTSQVARLRQLLSDFREGLDREVEERREALRYRLDRGRAIFEAEVLAHHRTLKVPIIRYLLRGRLLVLLTAPLIYAQIVPLVLLDLFVTLYQAVCFPVYRIKRVRRRDHIVIDRHRLAYLNGLQKLNCVFCGYANGVISYVREVTARTEQFWCPIKHAVRAADLHDRYPDFADYGDAEGFREKTWPLRKALSDED